MHCVADPADAAGRVSSAALIVCDETLYGPLSERIPEDGRTMPLLVVGQMEEDGRWPATDRIAKPVRPAKLRALLQHLLPRVFENPEE